MRLQHQWWSVLLAAVLGGLVGVTEVAAAGEQFIPVLGVREGATRSSWIPLTNGYIDYLTLLNACDGGINGVPLVWEECETVNDVTGVKMPFEFPRPLCMPRAGPCVILGAD